MPLSGGQTFAGYRIIRLLGFGGMGEVYLAEHPRLPRHNALKVLPAEVSADPDYRARFEREADLASKLWHPHIVSVHDRGEHDGNLWISMDFVDGLDAARLLDTRCSSGMPTDQVLRIVSAVASALDYAHKQGLLHRDVKPSNVMLTHADDDGDQRILLADFGIARSVDDVSGLTATNMTMGTVAYAAPEQLMGEDLDGRADQYALAATAYHLMTGRELFSHSNPAVVIGRHLNSPAPALSDARPDLAALEPVLAVALAKTPGDRFARCTDFARALEGAAAGNALPTARALTVKAPAADSAAQRSRVRRRSTASVAAIAVLASIAGAVLVWHPWYRTQPAASPTRPSAALSTTSSKVFAVVTPPPSAAPTSTALPATKVVTVAAVVDGQPANGFHEVESPGNVHEVSGCGASPAAVDFRIYSCTPTAAGANVCWPSTPGTLLCVGITFWNKGLYREYYTDELPVTDPPAAPQPFALDLDDGTQCLLRNGGAWGGRDDGYWGAYGCANAHTNVLAPGQRGAPVIDRSGEAWTVKVGQLGSTDEHLPAPETHIVTAAYFAGN